MLKKRSQLSVYAFSMLFIKMSFTIAVFLAVILISSRGHNIEFSSREIDARIISEIMLYNNVIMVNDNITGNVLSGVVNSSAFNPLTKDVVQEKLNSSMIMHPNVNYFSMKITLHDTSLNQVRSLYYNEESYNSMLTFIRGDFSRGKGGYTNYSYYLPIVVDEVRRQGFLHVEVILPN
ncbi:MAG: hypothetical protein ACMXYG_07080 [Candidatus Woesearchaeota archaeon]